MGAGRKQIKKGVSEITDFQVGLVIHTTRNRDFSHVVMCYDRPKTPIIHRVQRYDA